MRMNTVDRILCAMAYGFGGALGAGLAVVTVAAAAPALYAALKPLF